MNRIFKKIFGTGNSVVNNFHSSNVADLESIKILTARCLMNAHKSLVSNNIQDFEFKVFSQWGDDGIIQFLTRTIELPNKTFIEFGVEDYSESNTRFLLINNNWEGLIIDGSEQSIEFVRKQDYYWRHSITAIASFVTAENINELLKQLSFEKEIGIYHIDIDGNDYWLWKATQVISPVIVIMEYQSLFGCERAITTIYKVDFRRTNAHYSNLFYGASLAALCDLAEDKGYYFIGCNSAGNNAYFVRKDKIGNLKPLAAKDGYVLSKFREARDKNGTLLFLDGQNRIELIKGLEVFNVRTGMNELF